MISGHVEVKADDGAFWTFVRKHRVALRNAGCVIALGSHQKSIPRWFAEIHEKVDEPSAAQWEAHRRSVGSSFAAASLGRRRATAAAGVRPEAAGDDEDDEKKSGQSCPPAPATPKAKDPFPQGTLPSRSEYLLKGRSGTRAIRVVRRINRPVVMTAKTPEEEAAIVEKLVKKPRTPQRKKKALVGVVGEVGADDKPATATEANTTTNKKRQRQVKSKAATSANEECLAPPKRSKPVAARKPKPKPQEGQPPATQPAQPSEQQR